MKLDMQIAFYSAIVGFGFGMFLWFLAMLLLALYQQLHKDRPIDAVSLSYEDIEWLCETTKRL